MYPNPVVAIVPIRFSLAATELAKQMCCSGRVVFQLARILLRALLVVPALPIGSVGAAASVTYAFEGVVTHVASELYGAVSRGSKLRGTFTYDSSALLGSYFVPIDPTVPFYYDSFASISISIADFNFVHAGTMQPYGSVTVYDNQLTYPFSDVFTLIAGAYVGGSSGGLALNGYPSVLGQRLMEDSTHTAFDRDDLPVISSDGTTTAVHIPPIVLDLQSFDRAEVSILFKGDSDPNWVSIQGEIDRLSLVTAVPEPPLFALLIAGYTVVFAMARHRLQPRSAECSAPLCPVPMRQQ